MNHSKLNYQINELKEKNAYYQAEIDRLKLQNEKMRNDEHAIEAFLRENYFLKKENEDVFRIKHPF